MTIKSRQTEETTKDIELPERLKIIAAAADIFGLRTTQARQTTKFVNKRQRNTKRQKPEAQDTCHV